jgi:hypothetical protein
MFLEKIPLAVRQGDFFVCKIFRKAHLLRKQKMGFSFAKFGKRI